MAKYRISIPIRLLALLLVSTDLQAGEQIPDFTVKPVRCIALNQGQQCYQDLEFNWFTPEGEEYCLYQNELADPLICWTGSELRRFETEFVSAENILYSIRIKGQDDALSEAQVEVAWVYKSNRKSFSRWRLF